MQIVRTVVNAKSRKLKQTWTVEQSKYVTYYMGKSVEDAILKSLEEDENWKTKKSLMPSHWVIRKFRQPIDPVWLSENMGHDWCNHGAEYAFEDPDDAAWAILRWESPG